MRQLTYVICPFFAPSTFGLVAVQTGWDADMMAGGGTANLDHEMTLERETTNDRAIFWKKLGLLAL